MPGNEDEAAGLLDAYLERADSQARIAAVAQRASTTQFRTGFKRIASGSVDRYRPRSSSNSRKATRYARKALAALA